MSLHVHETALNSFNKNHSEYDKHRPSFQPEIVDPFLVDLGLAEKSSDGIITKFFTNKKVLELAAGTGKFTRNLVSHGFVENLTVVEPSEGMLESFTQNFPQIKAFQGSSYELPLEDNSVDVVVTAQAFHWFSDEQSLKEIYRVLKPRGRLGLIWNTDIPSKSQKILKPYPKLTFVFKDVPEATENHLKLLIETIPPSSEKPLKIYEEFAKEHPWVSVAHEAVSERAPNIPQYRKGTWRELFADKSDYYEPIESEIFLLYNTSVPRDSTFKTWATRSYVTALSEEKRNDLEKKVNDSLNKSIKPSDIINNDGTVYLKKSVATHAVTIKSKK